MPFKNPHPLYSVWQGMRRRCLNPNFKHFEAYGGRGIFVCKEWDDFHQFVNDMGPRPLGATIDRIDTDGPYAPWNCRWASRKEQARNVRRNVKVTIDGVVYLASELAEKTGLKTDTIVKRAAKGMSLDEVEAKTRYVSLNGVKKAVEARVARQLASTHCKRGHPWDDANTAITSIGTRICRACDNLRGRLAHKGKSIKQPK